MHSGSRHAGGQSDRPRLSATSVRSPWQATRRSMTLVGIPVEQQDACFRMVAAVLHMGNLEFADGAEEDSSQLAPAAAKHLDACAMLLGVQPDGLLRALTTRTRQTVDGQCPCSFCGTGQTLHLCYVVFRMSANWLVECSLRRSLQPQCKPAGTCDTSCLRLCRPHRQPHRRQGGGGQPRLAGKDAVPAPVRLAGGQDQHLHWAGPRSRHAGRRAGHLRCGVSKGRREPVETQKWQTWFTTAFVAFPM